MIDCPEDVVCPLDVTLASWTKGTDECSLKTAGNIDDSIRGYRRRHRTFGLPRTSPELFTGFKIVAASVVLPVHDNLLFSLVFDDQRRRPAGGFFTNLFPDRLSRQLVESVKSRWPLVIPRYQNLVSGQCRRTSFAEAIQRVHLSEVVTLPDEFSVERITEQTSRPEVGIDSLTIGARRCRGEAVRGMCFLMRLGDGRRLFPDQLAVVAVVTKHLELQRWQSTSACTSIRYCRRNKDAIFPDNRRTGSFTGDGDLPFHVLRGTPFRRRIRL